MIDDYYDNECDYGSFSGRKLRISPIEKENHLGPRIFARPHILAPSYKREQAKEKKNNHTVNNLEVYDLPSNNLRMPPIEKEQAHEKTKTLNFKKTPNIK